MSELEIVLIILKILRPLQVSLLLRWKEEEF